MRQVLGGLQEQRILKNDDGDSHDIPFGKTQKF